MEEVREVPTYTGERIKVTCVDCDEPMTVVKMDADGMVEVYTFRCAGCCSEVEVEMDFGECDLS